MTATIEGTVTTHEELMGDLLRDPEFRERWEATAFARLVANEIIRYRIEHGLSQRKLALMLDVHPSQVARLEIGEHEPRLSTLHRLSRVLGLSFGIDIHPVGHAPVNREAPPTTSVERAIADGVETLIYVAH
jgi:transcriptional regulator with XRE-family HTH domain